MGSCSFASFRHVWTTVGCKNWASNRTLNARALTFQCCANGRIPADHRSCDHLTFSFLFRFARIRFHVSCVDDAPVVALELFPTSIPSTITKSNCACDLWPLHSSFYTRSTLTNIHSAYDCIHSYSMFELEFNLHLFFSFFFCISCRPDSGELLNLIVSSTRSVGRSKFLSMCKIKLIWLFALFAKVFENCKQRHTYKLVSWNQTIKVVQNEIWSQFNRSQTSIAFDTLFWIN